MKQEKKPSTAARRAFIHKHRELFWFTPEDKKMELSDDILVETILNYGSWEAVREIFELMGVARVAAIFSRQINRKRHNYFTEIAHFFRLYFNKHAPKYTQ